MKPTQISSISEYCKFIGISAPKSELFDIRRFEDNMKTVNQKQEAFRHPFYAIAIKTEGTSNEILGEKQVGQIFFNTPYQIITWDIYPNWKGYYLLLSEEFIRLNPVWENFIARFSYFRLDETIHFDLPKDDVQNVMNIFSQIDAESQQFDSHSIEIIHAYSEVLLKILDRYYQQYLKGNSAIFQRNQKNQENSFFSQFKMLLEKNLGVSGSFDTGRRKPSFYAKKLNISPNYLNNICQKIAQKSTTEIIDQHTISLAKRLLQDKSLAIKSVAFMLHFSEAAYFSAFFKKHTGITPQEYKNQSVGFL